MNVFIDELRGNTGFEGYFATDARMVVELF
jgi:hypothetical protein